MGYLIIGAIFCILAGMCSTIHAFKKDEAETNENISNRTNRLTTICFILSSIFAIAGGCMLRVGYKKTYETHVTNEPAKVETTVNPHGDTTYTYHFKPLQNGKVK